MKAIVTGATGMIGKHFATKLEKSGYEVIGLARSSAASRLETASSCPIMRCDILDSRSLENVIKAVKPSLIIHMAAQAFNGTSWEAEEITHKTNYLGTFHLLRAVKECVPKAKVLLACSSAEYGNFDPRDVPLTEQRYLKPVTPYAVSKVAQEALGYQYFANYHMNIFLPRLFIHVGTGHPSATAIQNFARQLALIKLKQAKPIMKVGNLNSARDFIDVRDGVSAMMLLLEKGKPGEPVNICTGTAHIIADILSIMIEIAKVKVRVVEDTSLLRLTDEPVLLGDNSIIKSLGWKQQFTIQDTLRAVFDDWMERLSK